MSFEIEAAIRDLMTDLVADLLYYDRKGDEELQPGVIEAAIAAGDLAEAFIITEFAKALHLGVTEGR